ncbi:hypothetical protein MSPP1_004176 [Malassezia sp. CBS 17886]|nr:hypothetical protein MSPP1_004176 [Malassezia sp. CBS 17886]
MVTQAELEAAIQGKVGDIHTLFVSDVSGGCGQAYDVVIVSQRFSGMPTLKRHRLVNDCLKDEIAAMHAFSQKTYTPEQFLELRHKYTAESSDSAPAPSLAAPPAARGAGAHGRSDSAVSVPELTLTPDPDPARRRGNASPDAHNASSHSGSSAASPIQGPRVHTPFVNNTSISRLHYTRIATPEFWLRLKQSLENEFLNSDEADMESPDAAGASMRRTPGESEVQRLFEDFFLSQKHHLSANDVARVRDATGMLGMAGA